jgi:hypothetical protein
MTILNIFQANAIRNYNVLKSQGRLTAKVVNRYIMVMHQLGQASSFLNQSTSVPMYSTSSNNSNSSTPVKSDEGNSLPCVLEFNNLHKTEGLKAAKNALKELSGIYYIKCLTNGAMYIGSAVDLANRLVDHLIEGNTNEHLQSSIDKHGLENFVFGVVEFCTPYGVTPAGVVQKC